MYLIPLAVFYSNSLQIIISFDLCRKQYLCYILVVGFDPLSEELHLLNADEWSYRLEAMHLLYANDRVRSVVRKNIFVIS